MNITPDITIILHFVTNSGLKTSGRQFVKPPHYCPLRIDRGKEQLSVLTRAERVAYQETVQR